MTYVTDRVVEAAEAVVEHRDQRQCSQFWLESIGFHQKFFSEGPEGNTHSFLLRSDPLSFPIETGRPR